MAQKNLQLFLEDCDHNLKDLIKKQNQQTTCHVHLNNKLVDVCDLNKFVDNQSKTKFVFMVGEEDIIKIEIKIGKDSNFKVDPIIINTNELFQSQDGEKVKKWYKLKISQNNSLLNNQQPMIQIGYEIYGRSKQVSRQSSQAMEDFQMPLQKLRKNNYDQNYESRQSYQSQQQMVDSFSSQKQMDEQNYQNIQKSAFKKPQTEHLQNNYNEEMENSTQHVLQRQKDELHQKPQNDFYDLKSGKQNDYNEEYRNSHNKQFQQNDGFNQKYQSFSDNKHHQYLGDIEMNEQIRGLQREILQKDEIIFQLSNNEEISLLRDSNDKLEKDLNLIKKMLSEIMVFYENDNKQANNILKDFNGFYTEDGFQIKRLLNDILRKNETNQKKYIKAKIMLHEQKIENEKMVSENQKIQQKFYNSLNHAKKYESFIQIQQDHYEEKIRALSPQSSLDKKRKKSPSRNSKSSPQIIKLNKSESTKKDTSSPKKKSVQRNSVSSTKLQRESIVKVSREEDTSKLKRQSASSNKTNQSKVGVSQAQLKNKSPEKQQSPERLQLNNSKKQTKKVSIQQEKKTQTARFQLEDMKF